MTAAEFRKKWFDDPDNFGTFTDRDANAQIKTLMNPDDPYGDRCVVSDNTLRLNYTDARRDLAGLSAEDYASVSAKFPPHIWNSLSAVRRARNEAEN